MAKLPRAKNKQKKIRLRSRALVDFNITSSPREVETVETIQRFVDSEEDYLFLDLMLRHYPREHSEALLEPLSRFSSDYQKRYVVRTFLKPYLASRCAFAACTGGRKTASRSLPYNLRSLLRPLIAQNRYVRELKAQDIDPYRVPAKDYSCVVLEQQYAEWRLSITRAFDYFLQSHSADTERADKRESIAAKLGTLHHLSGSFPDINLNEAFPNPREHVLFVKNLNKPVRRRRDFLGVDLWLFQIWPIVQHAGWNYRDVSQAMKEKWKEQESSLLLDKPPKGLYERVDDVKKRCKQLKLVISEEGRRKSGKPSLRKSFLLSCESLAVEIQPFPLAAEALEAPLLLHELRAA